jgi:hypothetical protein
MGEGDYQQMSLGRKGYNEGKREKEKNVKDKERKRMLRQNES